MAIYEVVLRGLIGGVNTINRWDYVSTGSPGTVSPSFILAGLLGFIPSAGLFPEDTLGAAIVVPLTPDMEFVGVQVANLYDPTDFYEALYTPEVPGTLAGETAPLYVALGFISNQVTRAVRHATKRLPGVNVGQFGDQGALNSGGITNTTVIAARMSDTLTSTEGGSTLSFAPSVLSRLKYESHTSPIRYAYKLYPTETEQLAHAAVGVSWAAYANTRSQVSRQTGHGS